MPRCTSIPFRQSRRKAQGKETIVRDAKRAACELELVLVDRRSQNSETIKHRGILWKTREYAGGSLLLTGLCYNLGIWIDKFIFWFNPTTSEAVIGPLRASILYDLPIFLAYLSIIPGMAVFLVRIETDFAEWYERVYDAIRGGETLQHIGWLKEQMILAIRQGLMEICKVQGLTLVLLFLLAPQLLSWLGISHYYLPLFYIDVIGVSIQVVFMALLNVFFYLDKRAIVLELCVLFVLANGALTLFSQMLGPTFFGYGFTLSLLLCVLLGLYRLNDALEDLEFETFMLSR